MKKFLILIITIILVMSCAAVGVCADESVTVETTETIGQTVEATTDVAESASDTVTETVETTTETSGIDAELSSEIIEEIATSESKSDAIIKLAEKYGYSLDEAENIVNSFLEFGDEYLGEVSAWTKIRDVISQDMEFWALVAVCALVALALLGDYFMQLIRTGPAMRRTERGVTESVKIMAQMDKQQKKFVSDVQTMIEQSIVREDALRQEVADKEQKILELENKLSIYAAQNEKLFRAMFLSEGYNSQILHLITNRMALPLSDKAAIDLHYSKGNDVIKSVLGDDDFKSLDTVGAILGEEKSNETERTAIDKGGASSEA